MDYEMLHRASGLDCTQALDHPYQDLTLADHTRGPFRILHNDILAGLARNRVALG